MSARPAPPAGKDARLEAAVGLVLRLGVGASTVCLSLGLALSMAPGAAAVAHLLLNAGLIILMATPVGRVAISAVEYSVERDWVFVVLTLIVLGELAAGVAAAVR